MKNPDNSIVPTWSPVQKYDGGENVVFSHGDHSVSVAKTDSGLYDVQGDDGSYLYTGTDAAQAQAAVQKFLGK